MIGLLDTHTFLWCDSNSAKLSANARAFIRDPNNIKLLSVGSVWEIVIKQQLGKLTLRLPLTTILAQQQSNGIGILPASLDHVLALQSMPLLHKDPFDRLLIAQANTEGAWLITSDPLISQYPVKVLW